MHLYIFHTGDRSYSETYLITYKILLLKNDYINQGDPSILIDWY
jgi:hypothetical protein